MSAVASEISDRANAALSFALRGWSVFPLRGIDANGSCSCGSMDCGSPGKHPATSHGAKDASSDTTSIATWWRQSPDANVGIATGRISGLVVLDVDVPDGDGSLAAIAHEIGGLPSTYTVTTPSGGRHLYFAYDGEDVRNSAGKLGSGLDVRATGGYVVGAGSAGVNGKTYDVLVDAPVAPLPERLHQLLLLPSTPRATSESRHIGPGATRAGTTAYGRAALRSAVTAARNAVEGARNDTLNKESFGIGQLVGGGEVDEALARAELMAAGLSVGLTETEVERTIASGLGDGMREPRSAPPRRDPVSECARQVPGDGALGTRRPRIVLRQELAPVTDEAERALAADPNAGLYSRAGLLVHIARDGARRRRGLDRPAGAPTIQTASAAFVRERLDRTVEFVSVRETQRGQEERAALPPTWLVDTLLSRGDWPLPPLEGVIETPTLREDGSILDVPGYDEATGLVYEPSTTFAPVPNQPTADEMRAAVSLLTAPFADFPFVAACDRAAAAAALLTTIARPAIDGPAPLFACRATAPGTGKTLLVDVVSVVATGRPSGRMTLGRDDGETRKLILSIGLEGAPIVLIDNVEGALGSASLAAALTSVNFSDRLLGVSKMVTVSLRRATWFATGNGLVFRGDLGRRVVPIDLDAGVENPEDRTRFVHKDLLAFVRAERPRLVCAALVILRAFHVAGRPSHGMSPMGSFERWDALVRGACVWAGIGDPIAGRQRVREEGDTDLDALRDAVMAWDAAFGTTAVTVPDAVESAAENADLLSALAALVGCGAEKLDAQRVGYALRRVRGRLVDGKRFESGGRSHGKVRWRVAGCDRGDGCDVPSPPGSATAAPAEMENY